MLSDRPKDHAPALEVNGDIRGDLPGIVACVSRDARPRVLRTDTGRKVLVSELQESLLRRQKVEFDITAEVLRTLCKECFKAGKRTQITRKSKTGMCASCSASRARRKVWAAKTPEQRTAIACKVRDALSPEQRKERARKGQASRSFEQRRASWKKLTPEERSAITHKAAKARWGAYAAREKPPKLTPEERSEAIRKGHATRRARKA